MASIPETQVVEQNSQQLLEITRRYHLKNDADGVLDRMRDSKLGLIVLIIGEGNFGKSSLVNALSGREIAPVSMLPKTFKVDIYVHSGNGEEFAVIRRSGQEQGERVTIDVAEKLCKQDEEAIGEAQRRNLPAKPSLIEVLWHRSALKVSSNICLTDTPGLAQMLLGSQASAETIVTGLGTPYYVDEVWAMWYHRADVVLWCLPANKMESAETHGAIKLLVKKYQKTIIPVATKCDVVPIDRWNEISERFRSLYGDLLAGSTSSKLHLTVTGGKSDLRGRGVDKLRDHLQSLAPAVKERKLRATEQFTVDCSRHVKTVLEDSGRQLITNLRTIADSVDEISLEAMRQVRAIIERCQHESNQFVTSRKASLDQCLSRLGDELTRMEKLDYSAQLLQSTTESTIRSFLNLDDLNNTVHRLLNEVGREIERYAATICGARRLQKIRIGASGKETREEFELRLDIPLSSQAIRLNLNPPNFTAPSWLNVFQGWADGLGKWIKRTFFSARSRLTSLRPKVIEELDRKPAEIERLCKSYLSDCVGKALCDAVKFTFETATGAELTTLFTTLEMLDSDSLALQKLSQAADPARSQFELWAKYWTSVSPDAEVVKRLVIDVVLPNLTSIRTQLGRFSLQADPELSFANDFSQFHSNQTQRLASRPSHVSPRTFLRRSFIRFWGLGLPYRYLQCTFRTGEAYKVVSGVVVETAGTRRQQVFETTIASRFEQWVEDNKIVSKVDQHASEAVPNAKFSGFKNAFRQEVATGYLESFKQELERRKNTNASASIELFILGPLRFPLLFSPGMLLVGFLLGFFLVGIGAGLLLALLFAAISYFVPVFQLRQATKRKIAEIARNLAESAAQRVANGVSVETVNRVVDRLSVELNPRPLQRVLNKLVE